MSTEQVDIHMALDLERREGESTSDLLGFALHDALPGLLKVEGLTVTATANGKSITHTYDTGGYDE